MDVAEDVPEDGVLAIGHVGSGVSKWIWAIQEIARLVQSGHSTANQPFVAQVTGSGTDPENMVLQSTETALAFASGAGKRNYPWEPRLEGLVLVANLRTQMGRGEGVNPSTLPLAASPAQRRSSANEAKHARNPSGSGPWVLTVGEAEMA